MITQSLLDNLKNRLTADEMAELREQFGLTDPRYRSKWSRMWKVSPKQKRVDFGLVRAAKDMIKNRNSQEQAKINSLISEVELILDAQNSFVES